LVAAVVESFDEGFNFGQLHEVDNGFGGFEDLLFEAGAVHVEEAGEDAVGDEFLVGHDFGAVEGGDDFDEEGASFLEVAHDKPVDALVDLQFVLAFPIAALLEQCVAFLDILLDLGVVVQFQIDRDELEVDVHLLTDLDCLLQRQLVGSDRLVELLVVVVQFGLGKKAVSNLGLSEILFCIFYFGVFFGEELLEGFLDLHI
jgi:hypothetical protein